MPRAMVFDHVGRPMIKRPPSHFEGTISSFVDDYVAPNFPPADALIAWTEALLDYHRRGDAICVVRGKPPRGARRVRQGVTVVNSDNSPGRWVHLRAMDGTVRSSDIGTVLDGGALPVLYAARSDERPTWTYGLAMSARDKAAHSDPGLKHCHIAAAVDGAPDDPRALALRNLCPANHFLFPGPKKFIHRRDGWQEQGRGATDLGESQRVIAVVRSRLEEHVGPAGAAVLAAYDVAIGGSPVGQRSDGAKIVIVRRSPDARPSHGGAAAPRPRTTLSAIVTLPTPPSARSFGQADSMNFWRKLFEYTGSDERSRLILASPTARRRVADLQADISVEGLVGLGNAWFNKCDPRKLRKLHPESIETQAEQALQLLEHAKRNPALGGKWAATVDALRPAQSEGLARTRRLSFGGFLLVLRAVESQVYRAV